MIILLPEEEQVNVTKTSVIALEEEIINCFKFDFSNIHPLFFLERFLRVGELNENYKVQVLAEEISKLSLLCCSLLDHKPSLVAGASLILAYELANPSSNTKNTKLKQNCWNDALVKYTGYKYNDFEKTTKVLSKLVQSKMPQE